METKSGVQRLAILKNDGEPTIEFSNYQPAAGCERGFTGR